jgi:ubiquinol-cytochrome c reductase cytochrome c subunit
MRTLIRGRFALPVALVGVVGLVGLVAFTPSAAQAGPAPVATAPTATTAAPTAKAPAGAAAHPTATAASTASPAAAGTSVTGSPLTSSHGITYYEPAGSLIAPGQALYAASCASCHGVDAAGSARAPNLQGLGAGTVDFWVSTGRMPLANSSVQATRKPPRFNRLQTLEIAAFVQSRTPGLGIGIPVVNLSQASLAAGNSLFTLNCAACHTITGAGDELAYGAYAPSLHLATATQVVEAIRSGPGNMPHFSEGNITNSEARDIAAYVTEVIQHPVDRGGFGLGGIGPVGEGFVALLFGVGVLMLVAFWIGERS